MIDILKCKIIDIVDIFLNLQKCKYAITIEIWNSWLVQ